MIRPSLRRLPALLALTLAACGGDDGATDAPRTDAGRDVASMQRADGSAASSLDAGPLAEAGTLEGKVDGASRDAGSTNDAAPAQDAAFVPPDPSTLRTDHAAWQASLSKLRS